MPIDRTITVFPMEGGRVYTRGPAKIIYVNSKMMIANSVPLEEVPLHIRQGLCSDPRKGATV